MTHWFSYRPLDTITLKAAGRWGERGTADFFPLPAQTVCGALRTAVLREHGVDLTRGASWPAEVVAAIGQPGSEAPFTLTGPILRKAGRLLVPAPHHWYVQVDESEGKVKKKRLLKAFELNSPLIFYSSAKPLRWVSRLKAEALAGKWISFESLKLKDGDEVTAWGRADLADDDELRVGLELDLVKRSTKNGKLYSLRHLRLRPDVELVWAIDRDLPLPPSGLLQLGGERRYGRYERIASPLGADDGPLHLALSMVRVIPETKAALVAASSLQYLGGWDLKKGFHKPMSAYYPAGSVFDRPLPSITIPISE